MDIEKVIEEKIKKLKEISELLEIEKIDLKKEMLIEKFYKTVGYITALKDVLKDGDINGEEKRRS